MQDKTTVMFFHKSSLQDISVHPALSVTKPIGRPQDARSLSSLLTWLETSDQGNILGICLLQCLQLEVIWF